MQPSDFHYQKAVDIIKAVEYATLATVTPDGRPWNSPVYAAYDGRLRYFWASDQAGQHSANVRHNKLVFIAVYDSTQKEGSGYGVYLPCAVEELTETEAIMHGRTTLQERKGKQAQSDDYKKFTGQAIRRIYQATPQEAWINDIATDDQGNYTHDVRVKLDIAKLRSMLLH